MPPVLTAVPNISTATDRSLIEHVADAFASAGAVVLDIHSDIDHDRTVFTIAARQGDLSSALTAGGAVALSSIDLRANSGVHPRTGAVDVVPIVHRDQTERGAACAEALVAGSRFGRDLGVPVLLYGALGGGRDRASIRRGGPPALKHRMAAGEVEADFGPSEPDPRSGVVMVAARPVLIAFNLLLAPQVPIGTARDVAAALREGGSAGLPGVRALGLELRSRGRVQLSFNVELPDAVDLGTLVEACRERVEVESGELVGLPPSAVIASIPDDLVLEGTRDAPISLEESLRFHGFGL